MYQHGAMKECRSFLSFLVHMDTASFQNLAILLLQKKHMTSDYSYIVASQQDTKNHVKRNSTGLLCYDRYYAYTVQQKYMAQNIQ